MGGHEGGHVSGGKAAYPRRVMDVFRTPDERFEGLPGYELEPQYAEVDGLRLHYVDESPNGTGGSSALPAEPPRITRPIVCFHGEPTWAFLYRKMLGPLVDGGHRVICPDYAGFGRSDKPTDRGWYTYDRHLELVGAVLEGLDLSDAVVVVQDWGGPIGLRWAVENADRVGALVILNTGIFTGRVSRGFMAWREFAEKNPDLPVGFVIQGGTTSELPEDVVAAYEAPFPTSESKAGAAQFPLLVPTEEDAPGAAEMREIADALGRWEKPALIAFSDSDPVFPFPRAGERFVEWIPTVTEQVKIEGAAHFLQEDRGEQIAGEILRFLG
jgi:haloalkane dehalogenase